MPLSKLISDHKRKLLLAVAVYCLSMFMTLQVHGAEPEYTRQQLNFFEAKIRPVLVESCYECHSEMGDIEGKLRVDLREGLLVGGETGPAVVPKNREESLLLHALEYRDGLEMPPDGKLPANVIADFRRWIQMGAPDPRNGSMSMPQEEQAPVEAVDLWSLQPVKNPTIPEADSPWPQSFIDQFVFAKQKSAGVSAVADASPEELIRRVTFDLTGLPPSVAELNAFVSDPSEEAYATYVDRLLTSPQYGERWARHWFDIARYAESTGSSRDVLMPNAWRYRDYVIDAMNADVPYDRFITEQIAGDLLEADSKEERDRLQIATGFLAVGSKSLNGGNLTLDLCDDQIDVIGKSVLGMTVSCARCHDHKFDPIPTADYYALVGIFKSTQTMYGGGTNRPKNSTDALKVYLALRGVDASQIKIIAAHQKKLAQLRKQRTAAQKNASKQAAALPMDWQEQEKRIKKLLAATGSGNTSGSAQDESQKQTQPKTGKPKLSKQDQQLKKRIDQFRTVQKRHHEVREQLEELEAKKIPKLEYAVGVRDRNAVVDSKIHVRGEKANLGEMVPRGFLSAVSLTGNDEIAIGKEESGRRELAKWLTHPSQPLTPRVAVNRVWMHLFGRGIVETVDNFGVNAPEPTHPELLDHLAHRFVHEFKWSRKALIREIVMSRTYRLSSETNPEMANIDADNQFYWKHDRRRLEAEALRDAMLAVSGEMVLDRPEASIVTKIGEGEVGRGIRDELLDEPFPHRSVYLPIIRGLVPEFLKVFDFPEPSNPQGTRMTTNVPTQSLFLMNSDFVMAQSQALAKATKSKTDDVERIKEIYLRCFNRSPQADELTRAVEYLNRCRSSDGSADGNGKDEAVKEAVAWATLCQAFLASAEFRFIP